MDTFINNLLKFLKQALSKKPTGCGSPPLPRQSPLDTSVPLKVQKPEVPTTIKELDIDPVTSLGSLDSYTEQTIIANALQSIKQMKQSLSTAGPHKKLRSAPEPYIANSDIEISKQMGIPIPMLAISFPTSMRISTNKINWNLNYSIWDCQVKPVVDSPSRIIHFLDRRYRKDPTECSIKLNPTL